MTWQDEMHEAMAEYVRRAYSGDPTCETVVSYDEHMPSAYYCETCGPDPITVSITYVRKNGEYGSYSYYGGLGEFMREIT